jgi:hypothetical protein
MSPYVLLPAAVMIITGAYAISLWLHPWRPCRSCGGDGKTRDLLWRKSFGTCAACGGIGRRPRLGVKVFQSPRAQRMRDKTPSHKAIDERGGGS